MSEKHKFVNKDRERRRIVRELRQELERSEGIRKLLADKLDRAMKVIDAARPYNDFVSCPPYDAAILKEAFGSWDEMR